MFSFGTEKTSLAPNFLPDDSSQQWLRDQLVNIRQQLAGNKQASGLLIDVPSKKISPDLDSLFELICGLQQVVGQGSLEFTLIELSSSKPEIPPNFRPLGDPSGQMLHTLVSPSELALVYNPAIFRKQELLFASVARIVGRLALFQVASKGMQEKQRDDSLTSAENLQKIGETDELARAELAAIVLGIGAWVVNGAYVFENSCCGGGCGIDLSSVRTGLSMPEACFALALDSQFRGLKKRIVARQLAPTQKSAFAAGWKQVEQSPLVALPVASTSNPAIMDHS